MAVARFALVALDCPDPRALAEFYQRIIGGSIREDTAAHDWVRLETGTGVDVGFQLVNDYRAPEWPDGTPQQAHLDFDVFDLDEGEQAVQKLGSVKAEVQPEPDEWRVFLDPAGHPFCLVRV